MLFIVNITCRPAWNTNTFPLTKRCFFNSRLAEVIFFYFHFRIRILCSTGSKLYFPQSYSYFLVRLVLVWWDTFSISASGRSALLLIINVPVEYAIKCQNNVCTCKLSCLPKDKRQQTFLKGRWLKHIQIRLGD